MDNFYQSKQIYIKAIQKLSNHLHTKNHGKPLKSSQSSKDLNPLNPIHKKEIPSTLLKTDSSSKHGKIVSKGKKRNLSLEGKNEDETFENMKKNSSLVLSKPIKKWEKNQVPYSPGQVLNAFSKFLTFYEQGEIFNFRFIYYIADKVQKFEGDSKLENDGFDDENFDYILIKNDHVGYRYEILEVLGRGSYGQVIKVFDHKDHTLRAAKILKNMPCIHQQGKVELQILQTLSKYEQDCEFLISLLDNFSFRNHIILIFELLYKDLYSFHHSLNLKPFSSVFLKMWAEQILQGIQFFHRLSILHCDLKPENIMICRDLKRFKIIDFGSGCFYGKRVFSYIQSRFYRAPEVIFEIGYDEKIDIWSFACVLAELVISRTLFTGKDEVDQVLHFVEVLGPPPRYLLDRSPKKKILKDAIGKYFKVKNLENSVKTSKNGFRSPKDFKNKSLRAIIGEDTLLVDLISSNPYSECLTWDPAERLSSEEALSHPWLKKTIKNISSLPNLNEKFDSLKSPKNLKNPEKPEKKLFPETPKKGLKRSFFH